MRASGPQNAYEVYCYQCNVTAPVGTRRCIHCGGSLSSGAQDPRRAALAALIGADIREAGEGPEEPPPSIGSVAPKIAMWVLLLIGGFLYRFCN
jgi:hypothetical protein